MKTNTPEKIYVHEASAPELAEKLPYYIEYTRTDAFIKKAENYLRNKCQRFILTEKDIEDFVMSMKGE